MEFNRFLDTAQRHFYKRDGLQFLLRKLFLTFNVIVQYFYVERCTLVPLVLFLIAAIISNVLMARTVLMDPGLIPKFEDYYSDTKSQFTKTEMQDNFYMIRSLAVFYPQIATS